MPSETSIERRYLQSVKYAKNAATDAERRKLMAMVELFRKYGEQYKLDYLLMAAQGYQESTLDQGVKSPVGAIGVMQIMPATGKDLKVGDITQLEPNIHAGVKYMRFMIDQYFKDEPMDELNKGLMAFAAYNAGPGRLRQLRREAEKRGLNPERVVRQRRAHRVGAYRPRNGHLRQQHLQVLHRVPLLSPISSRGGRRRRKRSRGPSEPAHGCRSTLVCGVALSAQSYEFQSTWKAPGAEKLDMAGKKVTAVLISHDDSLRMSVEEADRPRADLARNGRRGGLPDRFRQSCWRTRTKRARWFERTGVSGVIVMRVLSVDKETVASAVVWSTMYYQDFNNYYATGWGSAIADSHARRHDDCRRDAALRGREREAHLGQRHRIDQSKERADLYRRPGR